MSLYSKTDLDRIAKQTGFLRDNLEKVFRLSDILQHFNVSPLLVESLVLKGGTAINLTVFNLPRLSVDIDLDFTKICDKEEMLSIREGINKEILHYMLSQGYSLSHDTKNPHSLDSWAFYYQNAAGNKDNLKIEINYSMRHHILALVERQTTTDFLPSYGIRVLSSLELFGSKIKALLERTAARDLYDVYNMVNQNVFSEDELPLLRKIVLFYWAVGGSKKPTINFQLTAIDKLKFPQIRSSLLPVLRKGEHFDFEKAKLDVKIFLSQLLVCTEDEIAFIDAFNQNNYQPELLFDDGAIIANIKNHPMAIWKTRTSCI